MQLEMVQSIEVVDNHLIVNGTNRGLIFSNRAIFLPASIQINEVQGFKSQMIPVGKVMSGAQHSLHHNNLRLVNYSERQACTIKQINDDMIQSNSSLQKIRSRINTSYTSWFIVYDKSKRMKQFYQ